MKNVFLLMLLVFSLAACSNSTKVEIKASSLKQELDTTLRKIKASVKAKGGRTLETVKEKINSLEVNKDSTVSDTSN